MARKKKFVGDLNRKYIGKTVAGIKFPMSRSSCGETSAEIKFTDGSTLQIKSRYDDSDGDRLEVDFTDTSDVILGPKKK